MVIIGGKEPIKKAKERNSAGDEPDDEGDLQITKQCEDYSGRSRGYGASFRIVLLMWRRIRTGSSG